MIFLKRGVKLGCTVSPIFFLVSALNYSCKGSMIAKRIDIINLHQQLFKFMRLIPTIGIRNLIQFNKTQLLSYNDGYLIFFYRIWLKSFIIYQYLASNYISFFT